MLRTRWIAFCAVNGILLLGATGTIAGWKARISDDPAFVSALDHSLETAADQVRQLGDPRKAPTRDTWAPLGDTGSALVNVCRISGDANYCDMARALADWFVFSNDYLVTHRDPKLPYLGWGPEERTGYFQCSDVGGYHADDLWDTATVLRFLLKAAELDSNPLRSPYFVRAKKIIDEWPYVDRKVDDSPYGKAGLRWYRKSNEPCENRYVKNTNIAMGEQLFRVYRLTRDPRDFDRAVKVLHTQLWDILVHRNLAYTSYMTYVDRAQQDYAGQVAHNERKVLHSGGGIGCGAKDVSCWNHLGYEGYAMFNIQEILRTLPNAQFPVAGTRDDIARTIQITMDTYRKSKYGNTAEFDWAGKDSTTHVTAYNCAQRFSGPVFDSECHAALRHHPASATVFYSLVPDSLLRVPQTGLR